MTTREIKNFIEACTEHELKLMNSYLENRVIGLIPDYVEGEGADLTVMDDVVFALDNLKGKAYKEFLTAMNESPILIGESPNMKGRPSGSGK